MLARVKARSLCLYASDARLCPVLRAGSMEARDKAYRLYSCGRCAKQVRICPDCDRGNRYCAEECARKRRRESLRRAAERYQQSYRGACKHAARQRALRKRQAQKVTHQGSQASALALIVVPTSTTTPSQGTYDDTTCVEPQPHAAALEARRSTRHAHREPRARWQPHPPALPAPRCCFCGCPLSRFARLGPLRAGP